MASAKFRTNLVFAAITALLLLTALTAGYRRLEERRQHPERVRSASPAPPAADASAARLAQLERLAAEDPRDPDALTRIANLHYDLGRFREAAAYYEKSLGLRPGDPNVETDLATCYHYLGEHDRALELLDTLLGRQPGFSQARFNKGIVLLNGKKDVRGAISTWEELLRTDPGYPHKEELRERILQLRQSAGPQPAEGQAS
jgi:tetratricopeptide (TPR) repeat protein